MCELGERGKNSLASRLAEEVLVTSQHLGQAWQTLGAKGLAGLRGKVGSRGGDTWVGNGIAQETRLGSPPCPPNIPPPG